jgi:phosphoglycerate kinase
MAFTFKKTLENVSVSHCSVWFRIAYHDGHQIGNSLFDAAGSGNVRALVEKAQKNNVQLVFPVDYITADKFDKNANVGPMIAYYLPSVTESLELDWCRY